MNAETLLMKLLPMPEGVRRFVARLPWQPPSLALALGLQRLLWPRLDASQRGELAGSVVEVEVSDLGLRTRVWIATPGAGFAVAPAGAAPRVRIRARAADYLRLLRGQEDPDRLFFERALVIEGDTEYALLLKNTLDAVGPLHLDAAALLRPGFLRP
ncbi:SCP2 sterol-binding domain-containing protein [uncultured Azohydromonas sp.]|uniref:ubiquinone anaerobic biosynthesis accessory factor UbiT n=1 Tax=uncultured Azohydromonas sp. TaxID=487342 RepID=UPI0026033D05|nr:SCP2 sterol-binding domain-containing protein [uncultured Azohydromonas sp.]